VIGFIKSLVKRLFGRRAPVKMTYVARYDEDGKLSDETRREVAKIKATDLKPGDQYQLGPNATVTVAPEGIAGKVWVAARIKASEERRKKKFELWWASKKARCVELMMMSEKELVDSGVKAEVDKFLSENQHFLGWAEENNLLPKEMLLKMKAAAEEKGPSGMKRERVEATFKDIMEQVKAANAPEELVAAGLVSDGRLVEATPEAVKAYAEKVRG
jgi:hypothetical protein